ncbi:unnamed protein product [Ceratitis capitata]|uniref:(Mediterranean fruit fly) hypothetical protein n=1 Tax=Ceratitis capitata TaxID=7213 RepID=A0A811USX2_CERCA|nr:unnamed protein product [Ceratitis capitata]
MQKSYANLSGLGIVATAVLGKFEAKVEIDGLCIRHIFLVQYAKINVDVMFFVKFHGEDDTEVEPQYKSAVTELIHCISRKPLLAQKKVKEWWKQGIQEGDIE